MILTYQDYEKADNKLVFLQRAVSDYRDSEEYKTACIADEYDRQKNVTINQYVQTLYSMTGHEVINFTASNNKIASNFFHRLNVQRATYSLGNGLSFSKGKRDVKADGIETTVDTTKELLGDDFDTFVFRAAYNALIHGVCYGFFNLDRYHVFPMTEFCPLWDETDGTLRAGLRFWSLEWGKKPVTVVFYEEDGYTVYRSKANSGALDLEEIEPKRGYVQRVQYSPADGAEIIGEDNYGSLPIVPIWGSRRHQSTLIGMREAIDSFDLIQSGFANDLSDCSQVYWLIGNAMGMDDNDLARFRDRLLFNHIAVADTDNSDIKPYTQEIPFAARQAYLQHIRSTIYESFGALDVTNMSAAAKTATEIESAYQPMDEEADDFEYQVIVFVQQLLRLRGIEDTPVFKRNRVSNQREQVEMVMMEANYLDDETVLQKLPNITPDEIPTILARKGEENAGRFTLTDEDTEEQPENGPENAPESVGEQIPVQK